jgi:hypothetical protein
MSATDTLRGLLTDTWQPAVEVQGRAEALGLTHAGTEIPSSAPRRRPDAHARARNPGQGSYPIREVCRDRGESGCVSYCETNL